jgi:hypothetical protein
LKAIPKGYWPSFIHISVKSAPCLTVRITQIYLVPNFSYSIDNTDDQNELTVNLNVTVKLDDNTVLYHSPILQDTTILRIPCDWNTGFYITGKRKLDEYFISLTDWLDLCTSINDTVS